MPKPPKPAPVPRRIPREEPRPRPPSAAITGEPQVTEPAALRRGFISVGIQGRRREQPRRHEPGRGRASLKDLALVEGFADVFEFPLPQEIFLHQRLALGALAVQLPPRVGFVIHLPVRAQLGKKCRHGSEFLPPLPQISGRPGFLGLGGLTGKASSCPRKSQTPEMLLSLLVPNRITLAKAFLRSLSRRWNMPGKREDRV